jgi:hypothetical protein
MTEKKTRKDTPDKENHTIYSALANIDTWMTEILELDKRAPNDYLLIAQRRCLQVGCILSIIYALYKWTKGPNIMYIC